MHKIPEVQPDIKLPRMTKVRVYTALVSCIAATPTIDQVLLNTLGFDLEIERTALGKYKLTPDEVGGFGTDDNKVGTIMQHVGFSSNNVTEIFYNGPDEIVLNTYQISSSGTAAEADWYKNMIEIRIYDID